MTDKHVTDDLQETVAAVDCCNSGQICRIIAL